MTQPTNQHAQSAVDDDGAATRPVSHSHRAAGRPAGRGVIGFLRETAIIVVSALVLSIVVKTFLVQAFFIPSESMEDTLMVNDRILVNKLAPGPFDLHRGDIVVFKDPDHWLPASVDRPSSELGRAARSAMTFIGLYPQDAGEHLVKRLIGLPGDRVACAGSGEPVTVNGTALDEPYLAPGAVPCQEAFDVVVPAGRMWVMGDNRQDSGDSREHQDRPGGGSVPLADVVGVAFVIVWPADSWTLLRNPGATFADVPEPS